MLRCHEHILAFTYFVVHLTYLSCTFVVVHESLLLLLLNADEHPPSWYAFGMAPGGPGRGFLVRMLTSVFLEHPFVCIRVFFMC